MTLCSLYRTLPPISSAQWTELSDQDCSKFKVQVWCRCEDWNTFWSSAVHWWIATGWKNHQEKPWPWGLFNKKVFITSATSWGAVVSTSTEQKDGFLLCDPRDCTISPSPTHRYRRCNGSLPHSTWWLCAHLPFRERWWCPSKLGRSSYVRLIIVIIIVMTLQMYMKLYTWYCDKNQW